MNGDRCYCNREKECAFGSDYLKAYGYGKSSIERGGKHHGKLKITLRLEAKMNMASAYKRMHQMWHDWKVPLAMM